MSIIHDALKKVQQTHNAGQPPPPAHVQEPAQSPEHTKSQDKINIPLFVAAACAVIAMIFAALPQLTSKRMIPSSTPVAAVPSTIPPAAAAPTAAGPSPSIPLTMPAPAATSPHAVSQAVADAVTAPTAPVRAIPAKKIIDPNDPLSSIQIEGVMDMGGKKVVLINGNVYEEGQTIHGRIISEITFDSLTVMENGRKRILPLKP